MGFRFLSPVTAGGSARFWENRANFERRLPAKSGHHSASPKRGFILVVNMSNMTYHLNPVSPPHKRLVWLSGEIKTPPMSKQARVEAGYLLRLVQMGEALSMPESRSMPSIGTRCHELRIIDAGTDKTWRIVYRTYPDAVVILEVFAKKSRATPQYVVKNCKSRLKRYDDES